MTPAQTIWSQLTIMTKMACGARKAIADNNTNTLQFDVATHGKRIRITLDPSDTYSVKLISVRTNRKTFDMTTKVLEEASDVYADQLNEVVYHMVNK